MTLSTPVATYRVQLNKNFGFAELEGIVPYLSGLGVSHVYASPIFKARAGSMHGYDIVDPNTVNPELGNKTALDQLFKTVSDYGLLWLQDIVPNHLAYSLENELIYDLFKNGPSSRYYSFFDVNWSYPEEWLKGKILAPFLQQPYSECLKQGLLSLVNGVDGSKVLYGNSNFPVNHRIAVKERSRQITPEFLDELLSSQFYALRYWKTALRQINYRRFFDITDLIGVRIENQEVFEFSNRLIFSLASAGQVSALRVDHIDGLYNPDGYLTWMREKLPDAYLIVEKILTGKEQLPDSWPVQGTTGYDFLNYVNKVFIERNNEREINEFYRQFTCNTESFRELLYNCKKTVIQFSFLGDIKNLARQVKQVVCSAGFTQTCSLEGLAAAILELSACFTVYRAYVNIQRRDFEPFKDALKLAMKKTPQLTEELKAIDYLLEKSEVSSEALHVVMKLQQFTSAVMAKGFEDTAFYRYSRFLSLNDVGGDPSEFGYTREEFNEFNRLRQAKWPLTLNATSTHDTKRGEDVRARLNVTSENPRDWATNVETWAELNIDKKRRLNSKFVPKRGEEYYFYQTLIGAFPWDKNMNGFADRLKEHMVKALREAKESSSWLSPNAAYEEAVLAFVDEVLGSRDFLDCFLPFQRKISYYGFFNTLSQTLLKITCPGVPDLYQGTELWDLSLVDPDNRRPVNFEERKQVLCEISSLEPSDAARLLEAYADGKAKFYVVYRSLQVRRRLKELFADGVYLPLNVEGVYEHSILAFARKKLNNYAVTVAPRFLTDLLRAESSWGSINWADTSIRLPDNSPSTWIEAFTDKTLNAKDGQLPVNEIIDTFPVALLVSGETDA